MRFKNTVVSLVLMCIANLSISGEHTNLLYKETGSVTLPSTVTGWDYIKFKPDSSLLFMARLKDGLTVFDVDNMTTIKTLENSIGANGPLILPEYNRAYIAMNDGTLLNVELDSLKTLKRTKLIDGKVVNSGILDAATKRMHFTTGLGKESSTWFVIDPRNGEEISRKEFPFRKMDDPASNGKGLLFAPVLIDKLILKLDAETLEEKARWDIGCKLAKLRYRSSTNRLIGACRGEESQVFILNPETGEKTARVDIGEGIDGIAFDDKHQRIITSDGEAGFLSVISMTGSDSLELLGRVNTRNGSRMMDIDKRTGKLYVVNADFTRLPNKDTGALAKHYHPNTFKVQEFTPE